MKPANRPFVKPKEPLPMQEFRSLPFDHEAELGVLGAMVLSPKAVHSALNILKSDDFFVERHQDLFKAMADMEDRKDPIDEITLSTELKRTDKLDAIGGRSELSRLFSQVPTVANIDFYAQTVKEKSLSRKCISKLTTSIAGLYSGDEPQQHLDDLFNFCTTDFGKSSKDFECDLTNLLSGVIDKISKAQNGERKPHIPSRFRDFDRQFKGWECGSLTVLLAPPKVGKSQLMINSADKIAQTGIEVGYILLDMMKDKIIFRFLSRRLKKTITEIEYGVGVTIDQIMNEAEKIRSLPLKVAGQENVGHDYKSTIRFMQYARKNFGTKIFFVDSFQKFEIRPEKGATDESVIATMINDFQATAQDLDVAIVGTVDLNMDGRAKGSSRWLFGSDSVFQLEHDVQNDTLKIESKFLRNGEPGTVVLTTNYSHSELRDVNQLEDTPRKQWNPD